VPLLLGCTFHLLLLPIIAIHSLFSCPTGLCPLAFNFPSSWIMVALTLALVLVLMLTLVLMRNS
jgi:hypothetical protein